MIPDGVKATIQGFLRWFGYELHRIQTDADRYAHYVNQPWAGMLKACPEIDFAPERQLQFVREVLPLYRPEFEKFPRRPSVQDKGFYLDNGWYGSIDAEVLYAMVRHYQPRRIIEVGSGFSTRVMRQVLSVNDTACELISIDPEPRADITHWVDRQVAAPVESVPPELFQNLQRNDILFIDSSHRVMPGGDVVYLVCEVLPTLKPGVLVHFHDICLPREYSAFELQHLYTEQYLVQAFLCGNALFDILFSGHYLGEYHRDELNAQIPSATPERKSGVLWLQRNEYRLRFRINTGADGDGEC